jgi:hypothetical protein
MSIALQKNFNTVAALDDVAAESIRRKISRVEAIRERMMEQKMNGIPRTRASGHLQKYERPAAQKCIVKSPGYERSIREPTLIFEAFGRPGSVSREAAKSGGQPSGQ